MNLILYANNNTGSGKQLQAVIEAIVCKNSIEIYRNVEGLSKRLYRRRYDVDVAVLLAASHKELQELLAIKELLHDIRIILLLPDNENETIAKGHKLYPRFLSYSDGNFDDVAAILSKMIQYIDKNKNL